MRPTGAAIDAEIRRERERLLRDYSEDGAWRVAIGIVEERRNFGELMIAPLSQYHYNSCVRSANPTASCVERRASGAPPPNKRATLVAEIEDPPALPPDVPDIDGMIGSFFVAHVKSRHEKAFAWALRARNIPYFLPLGERLSVSGRERYIVRVPLFPQYVFVGGDDEYGTVQAEVMGIPGKPVCRTIRVRDQVKIREQLSNVYRAIQSNPRLESCVFALPGRMCRVTSGPWQGLTGKVVQRGKDTLIQLEVETLGRYVPMEIDGSLLEPLD